MHGLSQAQSPWAGFRASRRAPGCGSLTHRLRHEAPERALERPFAATTTAPISRGLRHEAPERALQRCFPGFDFSSVPAASAREPHSVVPHRLRYEASKQALLRHLSGAAYDAPYALATRATAFSRSRRPTTRFGSSDKRRYQGASGSASDPGVSRTVPPLA